LLFLFFAQDVAHAEGAYKGSSSTSRAFANGRFSADLIWPDLGDRRVAPQDLYLKSPAHVRLMGKGQKERISPIWPETAELLTSLIERNDVRPDERLFVNRCGAPLTASGFRFRLRQYVRGATVKQATLSQKRITPHVFWHTTAVHPVAAGVDVTVIRSWLGHAHLDTTNHLRKPT
jgi:site-specific recombinase XerD